jgi:nucleoside-diphosphate-sugar epimerase
MANYLTGKGFIGSNILKRIDAIHIPHEQISIFKLKPFDNFYFCSAYGNMSDHTDDDKIIKANLLDLISLLRQAVKLDFKSFTYISTSSVTLPVQTTYSRTKRASEEVLLSYDKFPITIIRPYTICGVGDNEKHLIPVLIKSALNGTEVNLSDGSHDYIDIEDMVNGILSLSGQKGIFELGSGIITTNERVLEMVEFVTGKKIKVNRVSSLRSYDNPDWRCKNPAFKTTKSLLQSIKEEYEYIKNNRN